MDIFAEAKKGLTGAHIKFPSISVGATENVIITKFSQWDYLFKKLCMEPEEKLTDFLNKTGASISWLGKREIKIIGCKNLNKQATKLCLIE